MYDHFTIYLKTNPNSSLFSYDMLPTLNLLDFSLTLHFLYPSPTISSVFLFYLQNKTNSQKSFKSKRTFSNQIRRVWFSCVLSYSEQIPWCILSCSRSFTSTGQFDSETIRNVSPSTPVNPSRCIYLQRSIFTERPAAYERIHYGVVGSELSYFFFLFFLSPGRKRFFLCLVFAPRQCRITIIFRSNRSTELFT